MIQRIKRELYIPRGTMSQYRGSKYLIEIRLIEARCVDIVRQRCDLLARGGTRGERSIGAGADIAVLLLLLSARQSVLWSRLGRNAAVTDGIAESVFLRSTRPPAVLLGNFNLAAIIVHHDEEILFEAVEALNLCPRKPDY